MKTTYRGVVKAVKQAKVLLNEATVNLDNIVNVCAPDDVIVIRGALDSIFEATEMLGKVDTFQGARSGFNGGATVRKRIRIKINKGDESLKDNTEL